MSYSSFVKIEERTKWSELEIENLYNRTWGKYMVQLWNEKEFLANAECFLANAVAAAKKYREEGVCEMLLQLSATSVLKCREMVTDHKTMIRTVCESYLEKRRELKTKFSKKQKPSELL